MDNSEVLYEAFKETYIQTRKVYFLNIMMAIFALLVILLNVRDAMLIKGFEPQMGRYQAEAANIDERIAELKQQTFELPASYRNARIAFDKAKLEVNAWHKELPARKKMKEKYERYLEEYSGSHDKVLERLKIDGEPGLDLFQTLRESLTKAENAKEVFDNSSKNVARLKEKFKIDIARTISSLESQQQRILKDMDVLREDINAIIHDKTRIPWLGLRINPQDIVAFLPILLMVFFHTLFDRFDEILNIIKKPQVEEFRSDLKEYPLPIFLGKRNYYGLFTNIVMFSSIPALQITALIMSWRQEVEILAFGAQSTYWLLALGTIACMVSLAFPAVVVHRHRRHVFN